MHIANIHMYHDGEDFGIIIKNTSAELNLLICEAVQRAVMGVTCDALPAAVHEPVMIEGLEAEPVSEEAPKELNEAVVNMEPYTPGAEQIERQAEITEGKYSGMTANAALNRFGVTALADLFNYCLSLGSQSAKAPIASACKRYMTRLPETVKGLKTKKERLDFIQTVSQMYDVSMFIVGYNGIEGFAHASEKEIEDAVSAIAEALMIRGKKKAA